MSAIYIKIPGGYITFGGKEIMIAFFVILCIGILYATRKRIKNQAAIDFLDDYENAINRFNNVISAYNSTITETERASRRTGLATRECNVINIRFEQCLGEAKKEFDYIESKDNKKSIESLQNSMNLLYGAIENMQEIVASCSALHQGILYHETEMKKEKQAWTFNEEEILTESRRRARERREKEMMTKAPAREMDMFQGCNTKEELQKRYRALSKAYHPDGGAGDAELFEKMTAQYRRHMTEIAR